MRNSLLITIYSFLKIYDKFTKVDIIFSIYASIKCLELRVGLQAENNVLDRI